MHFTIIWISDFPKISKQFHKQGFEFTPLHEITFDTSIYREHLIKIKTAADRFYVEVQSKALRENERDSIPFTFNLESYIKFLLAGPLVLECIDKLLKNGAGKKEAEQPKYEKRHVERMSICD